MGIVVVVSYVFGTNDCFISGKASKREVELVGTWAFAFLSQRISICESHSRWVAFGKKSDAGASTLQEKFLPSRFALISIDIFLLADESITLSGHWSQPSLVRISSEADATGDARFTLNDSRNSLDSFPLQSRVATGSLSDPLSVPSLCFL